MIPCTQPIRSRARSAAVASTLAAAALQTPDGLPAKAQKRTGWALGLTSTLALAGALAWGSVITSTDAAAHEINTNRATVVLRDETHITLTGYVNYTQALHQALAPQLSAQEFVLTHAGMKPSDLQLALERAQQGFEKSTVLKATDGQPLALQWRWPDLARVQAQLQQRAMQAVVAPAEHGHEEPLEVQAQARAANPIQDLSVQLPPQWGSVLLVSYRPKQMMSAPGKATRIRF